MHFKGKGDFLSFSLFSSALFSLRCSCCLCGAERSLRYNEIPLILKRSLRDDKEEPHFSIRNIRQYDESESLHSSTRESKLLKPADSLPGMHERQTELDAQLGEEEKPPTAVGIYEYVKNLDDEISICIGDSVKILRRATGWLYVQKGAQFGWSPAGCLDEEEKVRLDPLPFFLSAAASHF